MTAASLVPIVLLLALPAAASERPANAKRYRECVRACADNLTQRGTDRYGSVHLPVIMSVIDTRTGDAPQEPPLLDGFVRGEERPGRRNPGGSDLWEDQPLLHCLYRLSSVSRAPRYREAADAYIRAYLEHARKPNGLVAWGSHLFYNAYTDRIDDDRHGNPHEILIHLADWESMWRVNPVAVRQEIEGIWRWHICDQKTGQHNRHDDASPGCDFAFSGGSFAHAFAFLYSKTRDHVWLDRAKLVADWHWSHRNRTTNLAPDAPSTGDRYDATHCFTTVSGPHAAALLRCWELTKDPFFRDVALGHIDAWRTYAWDEKAGMFYAAVKLDGTPIREGDRGRGYYDAWMPTGYAETWPTTMYSYEFPLAAAQTATMAYEITRSPMALDAARKWARHIRATMPPVIGRRWYRETIAAMPEAAVRGGAYADGYGRAISFFAHLHRATRDPADLAMACQLADEAIDRLYVNEWFRGQSGKPTYEATDGVGVLLSALLELSAYPRLMPTNM